MTNAPISACSLALPPADLWARNAPASFKGELPIGRGGPTTATFSIGGSDHAIALGDGASLGMTVAERLSAQHSDGVAAEVLYPDGRLTQLLEDARPSAEAFVSYARVYNDWLAEYCGASPHRLMGVGLIPGARPDDAAKEARRCIESLGLRGLVVHGFPSGGVAPSPRDDAVWAVAAELGVPISIHGPLAVNQAEETNLVATEPYPTVAKTLASFVYGGVLDRFPTLKLIGASSSCGWVPYWLERMDDQYMRTAGTRVAHLGRAGAAPSDYVRESVTYTFSRDHLALKYREYIGVGKMMWASMFGTPTSEWPKSCQTLDTIQDPTQSKDMALLTQVVVSLLHDPRNSSSSAPSLPSSRQLPHMLAAV